MDRPQIGVFQEIPRHDVFRLPAVPPLVWPQLPMPVPILPTPALPIDQRTIDKAIRKGHDLLKGLFDKLTEPPTRFIAEGVAVAGASAFGPVPGSLAAVGVLSLEGERLLKAYSRM